MKSTILAVLLCAVSASAQLTPIDAVTPITTYRISDAKGNSLGTPVYMDPQEIRIPFLPAIAGVTMDDAIILSYGVSTETRDHQPRGHWFVTRQSALQFDGPDCTGNAFVTYYDDLVMRRAATVTQDGRLWISEPNAQPTQARIQSATVDSYIGEWACNTRNPAGVATVSNIIPVRLVGTIQFAGPLSITLPPRERAVSH